MEDPLHHLETDERRLFHQFLVVIRDNYRVADKAAFYLERKAGIQYAASLANLRDVLSHLATFLDPATETEKRAGQLATAEEHLRRSIIDSYELALADLGIRFQKLYDQYRQLLLPVKDRDTILSSAPNDVQIQSALAEIESLRSEARDAKCRNTWDRSWEEGIAGYPTAYDKLQELYSQMEGYWYKYDQRRRDRRRLALQIWAWATSIGMAVLLYLLRVRSRP